MFLGSSKPPAAPDAARAGSVPNLSSSLRKAHLELEESMEALARVTGEEVCPPSDVIARARWRLSAASRMRSNLSMEAVGALRASEPAEHSADLDHVSRLTDQIRDFTQHYVQDWTPAAVLADWPGYRRASEKKRRLLASSIELERTILYKLLEQRGL